MLTDKQQKHIKLLRKIEYKLVGYDGVYMIYCKDCFKTKGETSCNFNSAYNAIQQIRQHDGHKTQMVIQLWQVKPGGKIKHLIFIKG